MDFGTLTLYRRGEHPQPFRLRLGSLSIGSDPSADISIDDGLLERFHARVVCTPAGCQLTDLGSKHGTLVNKDRLAAHAPRLLGDGDRIQLGRVGLLYSAPAPAVRASPSTGSDAEPVRSDSAPVTSHVEPITSHVEPVRSDSAPVTSDVEPVTSDSGPVRSDAEPVRSEAAPITSDSGPVRSDATPVTSDSGLARSDTTPARSDAPPARSDTTPARSDAPPAKVAATPARAATATVAPADDWNVLFQVPTAPEGGAGATLLPGNRRRRRPLHDERDLPYEAEDYLALLPPIYHDDRFLRRFLLIFKASLDPLDRQIAQIYHYFDPRTAPEHMLPWLAAWVDLVLDERWPEARRRELIGAASVLYRWRGTRRGLSDYLRIYSGVTPRIVEQGQEQRGEPLVPPHTFRVIIDAPDLEAVDRALVERIIEMEKPAHTAYQLEIRVKGER